MLKLKDITLANNIKMPPIGLGVYKMQAGLEMNQAVKAAYENGYRLFDTAQMYGNEAALGTALKENDIPREDIFLVSKVDNGNQWYDQTLESLKITLEKLQTSYLDAFLVHWPGQNKERTISTWKAMEEAYESGLVKSIGVCNFEIDQLQYLMEHCRIQPMINQIEYSPLFHQPELVSYCKEHQIQVMACGFFNGEVLEKRYCPLQKNIKRLRHKSYFDGIYNMESYRFQNQKIRIVYGKT